MQTEIGDPEFRELLAAEVPILTNYLVGFALPTAENDHLDADLEARRPTEIDYIQGESSRSRRRRRPAEGLVKLRLFILWICFGKVKSRARPDLGPRARSHYRPLFSLHRAEAQAAHWSKKTLWPIASSFWDRPSD